MIASPSQDEQAFRGSLAAGLAGNGYFVKPEAHLGRGQRCDIAAIRDDELVLIEAKIARPFHGLGQALGYASLLIERFMTTRDQTWPFPWARVRVALAVPTALGYRHLMSLSPSCMEAGVELWVGPQGDGEYIVSVPERPVVHRTRQANPGGSYRLATSSKAA